VDVRSRLLSVAAVGLVWAWLMPNHYPPWTAFHAEAMSALALLPVAVWSALQRQKLEPLAVAAFALSLVPLAQALGGQIYFAGDAWMAWLYIAGFGLMVQCGSNLVREGRGSSALQVIVPIQVGVIFASLVSAGMAGRQWLDLGFVSFFVVEKSADSRPYANLAQPNQLASLLMMGLASIAFLYEAKKVRASLALLAAFVIAAGIAMTQSRTALLGFALTWVAYVGLRRRAGLRITFAALIGVTAFYLLLAWIWPWLDEALLLKHAPSLTERMGSNLRLVLWRSMLAAVSMHPLAGWGWGQVGVAQQAVALDFPPTYWWFESAHNLFFDLALWAGIPVSLGVAACLFAWIFKRVRDCVDPLSWCLLIAIGCIFCHAMVEFPLSYAYLLLPVGLLMGALGGGSADVAPAQSGRRLRTAQRLLLGAVSILALAAYAKVVMEYLVLEQEWRDLRLSRALVGAEEPPPSPNIVLLTQLKARADYLRIDPAGPGSEAQLEMMGHVAKRYGTATFMFPYARSLALAGRRADAEREIEIMCRTQQPSFCERARREWASLGLSDGESPSATGNALPAP